MSRDDGLRGGTDKRGSPSLRAVDDGRRGGPDRSFRGSRRGVVPRFGPHFLNGADNAVNELRIRDIGSHPVSIGPYSRNGWSHPGPVLYYVLGIFYFLSGARSIGMYVGALVINLSAVLTVVFLARRYGGSALMLIMGAAMALVLHHLGATFLSDPWNTWVPVLPFGAFLMLCWAATLGSRWAIPGAVAVGSFCVQSHVGFLPMAAPVLLAGTIMTAAHFRRAGQPLSVLHAPLFTTAATAVLMWAPPIIQQVSQPHGNLGRMVAYFRDSDQPVQSLGRAYGLVARRIRPNSRLAPARPVGDPRSTERVNPGHPVRSAPLRCCVRRSSQGGPSRGNDLEYHDGRCDPGPVRRHVENERSTGAVSARPHSVRRDPDRGRHDLADLASGRRDGPRRRKDHVRHVALATIGSGLVVLSAANVAAAIRVQIDADPSQRASMANGATVVPHLLSRAQRQVTAHGQVIVTAHDALARWFLPATVLWLERHGYDARVPLTEADGVALYDDSPLVFGTSRICSRGPNRGAAGTVDEAVRR